MNKQQHIGVLAAALRHRVPWAGKRWCRWMVTEEGDVRELFEIYDSMRVAKRFRKTGRHPRDQ